MADDPVPTDLPEEFATGLETNLAASLPSSLPVNHTADYEADRPSRSLAGRLTAILLQGPRLLALLCIRIYQTTSVIRPSVCRYYPSCSEYTAQCIHKHGVVAGIAYGIRRVLRCNPFSPGGYDPIP